MTICVLLADDQALIRAGFNLILDAEPGMQVVGEAVDGREAVDLVRTARADVVLMDIRMPGMDGLEATRRIVADDDLAGVRVLILTTFDNDDNVVQAIRAGASGFLGKSVEPAELVRAVELVARGGSLLSPKATRALISRFLGRFLSRPGPAKPTNAGPLHNLTARERQILTLVAHGLSNEDIAERLYLSPLTVRTHVNRAMTKLSIRDRAQLVVLAYQHGHVRPGGPIP